MNTTNHTSPSGEDAVCSTCNGHGMIGGPSYYSPDEGGEPCPDCNVPQIVEDAANGAIGEREAFEAWWMSDVPEEHRVFAKKLLDGYGPDYTAAAGVADAWDAWQARAALTAGKMAQAEPVPVEVWHGERKVTIYPDCVLRVWGTNIESEMSDAARNLQTVQDAMDWLYAAPQSSQPVEAGGAVPSLWEAFEMGFSLRGAMLGHVLDGRDVGRLTTCEFWHPSMLGMHEGTDLHVGLSVSESIVKLKAEVRRRLGAFDMARAAPSAVVLDDELIEQRADETSSANGYGVEDGTGIAHSHWWTFDRDGLHKFARAAPPQPVEQTERALPDAAIEATSALIANSLLGAAPEEDVREVERLINEMLGRT